MEELLVNKLIEKNYKISTAESATGGLISATIINVTNASKVLSQAIVTYSDEAKNKYLGVSFDTIEKYNVVSENVAKEMVLGLINQTGATVGVSVTGVAGPSGGTKEIPVGTICFGFYVNGNVKTTTKLFENMSRNEVRSAAVKFAISSLINMLNEE